MSEMRSMVMLPMGASWAFDPTTNAEKTRRLRNEALNFMSGTFRCSAGSVEEEEQGGDAKNPGRIDGPSVPGGLEADLYVEPSDERSEEVRGPGEGCTVDTVQLRLAGDFGGCRMSVEEVEEIAAGFEGVALAEWRDAGEPQGGVIDGWGPEGAIRCQGDGLGNLTGGQAGEVVGWRAVVASLVLVVDRGLELVGQLLRDIGADDVGGVLVDGAVTIDVDVGIVVVATNLVAAVLLDRVAGECGPATGEAAGDRELEAIVMILVDEWVVGGLGPSAAVVRLGRGCGAWSAVAGEGAEGHRRPGHGVVDWVALVNAALVRGDRCVVGDGSVDVGGGLYVLCGLF